MKKKFLIVSLATMLCLVSLTTVNAAPAESPAPAVYTTAATPTDFALMKQLFNAEEYAEMYPDVVAAVALVKMPCGSTLLSMVSPRAEP